MEIAKLHLSEGVGLAGLSGQALGGKIEKPAHFEFVMNWTPFLFGLYLPTIVYVLKIDRWNAFKLVLKRGLR